MSRKKRVSRAFRALIRMGIILFFNATVYGVMILASGKKAGTGIIAGAAEHGGSR